MTGLRPPEGPLLSNASQMARPDPQVDLNVQLDEKVVNAVNERVVKEALQGAVQQCKFCVTIANPKGEDYPLIAVSEEFENMTGFLRSEIIGVNCRFLNQGCDMDPRDLMNLRIASQTGAPFTAILPNRKKSGELFLNLLDVRGLTVARDTRTGEDVWYLIGIQADVSELGEDQVPDDHFEELQMLSDFLRSRFTSELSQYALSSGEEQYEAANYEIYERPFWRAGEPLGRRGKKELPGLVSDTATAKQPASEGRERSAQCTKPRQSLTLGLIAVLTIGTAAALFYRRRRQSFR